MLNGLSWAMKVSISFTYLLMLTVNALANILPINGVTTGQVADSYHNLFAPAGITFAIWGLIYLLLAAHVLYQLGLVEGKTGTIQPAADNNIAILFSLSSLANTVWIFMWHYRLILLSVIIITVLLVCLIAINLILFREKLTLKEKIFFRFPFSVYFGWITVATIANVTTLLVSQGWNGWGLSEPVWAIIMLIVGMLIGAATTIRQLDIAYGFTIVWAYIGILIKHESETGFSGRYPQITVAVMICLLLLVAAICYVLRIKERQGKLRGLRS